MNDVVVSWLFADSSARWRPCAWLRIAIPNRNRQTMFNSDTHGHNNACMKKPEVADGWARDGARWQGHTRQTQICKMLSISIEKQRKCSPFFKLCLADRWAEGLAGERARLARRNTFD